MAPSYRRCLECSSCGCRCMHACAQRHGSTIHGRGHHLTGWTTSVPAPCMTVCVREAASWAVAAARSPETPSLVEALPRNHYRNPFVALLARCFLERDDGATLRPRLVRQHRGRVLRLAVGRRGLACERGAAGCSWSIARLGQQIQGGLSTGSMPLPIFGESGLRSKAAFERETSDARTDLENRLALCFSK